MTNNNWKASLLVWPSWQGWALSARCWRRRVFRWSIRTKGCTPRLPRRWSRAAIGSCRTN